MLAPAAGRILKVPVSEARVVLPGETIATLAEDQYILRLQLPERHARFMRAGDEVRSARAASQDTGERREGKVRRSSIRRSRAAASSPTSRSRASAIISSASARASMSAPGTRKAIVIPRAYVYRRAGVNYVKLADGDEVVVQTGEPHGARRRRNPLRPQGRRQAGRAMKLGLSGLSTRAFINSPLTPLLLLAALVAGALALASLPREEEPQISVPMVDIMVTANGYKADEAVELVTRPLEDIVKGINGVEHVYSQTRGRPRRRHRALSRRHGSRTPRSCACTRRSAPHIDRMPEGHP